MDTNQDKKKQSPFEDIATKKGYSPERLKSHRDNCKNVSHILNAKGKKGNLLQLRVDLKKIKNKKQNEDWIWLEFKNGYGNPGWLHGDADFIIFERIDDFVVVNRKELVSWVGSCQKIRYDLPFVGLAKRAKYRIYRRPKTREEVSQVELKELKKLKSFQIWKK